MGKKAKSKQRDKVGKKARHKAGADDTTDASPASSASIHVDQGMSLEEPPPELQRAPVAASATELAARLANLSTVLQRQLARADSGDGLTRARLSALALLVLGGPRTLGALAAAERVRPPTMTRLVHAMEADGLVVREAHPSDGRSIIIRATAKGEGRLERGRARQIAPLAESIADLDRAERVRLADASDLLGRVLRDAAWETPEPSA
jgi:DNA-binding MarR family transcriptional regulator